MKVFGSPPDGDANAPQMMTKLPRGGGGGWGKKERRRRKKEKREKDGPPDGDAEWL